MTNGAYYLRVTPNRDMVLLPRESESLLVEFTPTEPGVFNDTIAILSNNTAFPEFQIPVESHSFDPLTIGRDEVSRSQGSGTILFRWVTNTENCGYSQPLSSENTDRETDTWYSRMYAGW